MTSDDIELTRALHHLLWVWYQYGTPARGDMIEGRPIRLSHNHLLAGEQAGDFLIKYGLAIDDGDAVIVSEAGRALMAWDASEASVG